MPPPSLLTTTRHRSGRGSPGRASGRARRAGTARSPSRAPAGPPPAAWCASAAPIAEDTSPSMPLAPRLASTRRPARGAMCRSRSRTGRLDATHSSAPAGSARGQVAGQPRLAERRRRRRAPRRRRGRPRRRPRRQDSSQAGEPAPRARPRARAPRAAGYRLATSVAVRAGSDQRPGPWASTTCRAGRQPARGPQERELAAGQAGPPGRDDQRRAGARPVNAGRVQQVLVGRAARCGPAGRPTTARPAPASPACSASSASRAAPRSSAPSPQTITPRSPHPVQLGGSGSAGRPAERSVAGRPASASTARRPAGRRAAPASRAGPSPAVRPAAPGTSGSRSGRFRCTGPGNPPPAPARQRPGPARQRPPVAGLPGPVLRHAGLAEPADGARRRA